MRVGHRQAEARPVVRGRQHEDGADGKVDVSDRTVYEDALAD